MDVPASSRQAGARNRGALLHLPDMACRERAREIAIRVAQSGDKLPAHGGRASGEFQNSCPHLNQLARQDKATFVKFGSRPSKPRLAPHSLRYVANECLRFFRRTRCREGFQQ
jgi:hypothetical protein